jgi:subtilisin family serine protease
LRIFTRHCLLVIIFVLLLGAGGKTQQRNTNPVRLLAGEYVEGELLIKYRGDSSAARASLQRAGGEMIRNLTATGWQQIRLPSGTSVADGLDRYGSLPGIESAQPNFIYHTLATTDDPRLTELYGLNKIQAPAAWDTTTGSPNVVVADIDLGVDYNHEDLNANMWRNPGETGPDAQGHDKATNVVDDDGDGYVDDVYGIDTINHDSDPMDDSSFSHGTHTSGTIGAVGNNGKGVVGVNWAVRIMAIKSHDAAGNGSSASVVEAFHFVAMMRRRGINIRVTNSSWGGAPEAPAYDQALKDAIDDAGNAGIVNVCAAGNSNSNNDATPFYPASYDSPSIISVAASDQGDNRAGFSSYGATSVDLAAPGVSILSTTRTAAGSYGSLSGTSMATPHVAGAVALLCAYNQYLTVPQIKSLLLGSVDVLPQWSGLTASGGRLNVARALANIPTTNQIDDASYFVRQHYLDFLDRQPDQGGLAYWTNEIARCGANAVCVGNRRIDVSGQFFIEQEFQLSGGFIYRLYGASLGRRPTYTEFTADHDQVIGGPNLEASKSTFADQFVQRTEFLARYPISQSASQYVDGLLITASNFSGLNNSGQSATLVGQFNTCLQNSSQAHCRALTLRQVSDDANFAGAVYNSAFVLMEYFGYLRRNPDQGGYNFWLNVLNSGTGNNYRGMVCAFITSPEYQVRFAPVVSRTNAECQ